MNNSILYLVLFLNMLKPDYEILKVADLKTELKNSAKGVFDFDVQLPYSNAFVYRLKSGKVVLMPNNLVDTSEGILFENENIFQRYESAGRFPVDNEDKTLEELFQKEIIDVGHKLANDDWIFEGIICYRVEPG